MPRLNRRGDALMGVGLSAISVNGREITGGLRGGWGGWLDDDTVVVQDTSLGYAHVVAVDVKSGSYRVLAARGANQVVAGDGVWAIWSTTDGYLDSFGRAKPDYVSVELDWWPVDAYGGSVIFQPAYHGSPHRFRWDGKKIEQAVFAKWPWRCGHVEGHGLCAWPEADQTRGIVLSTDGHDFHPDVCVFQSGNVYVASSYGQAERPYELRTYLIDITGDCIWFQPHPSEPLVPLPLKRTDLTQPVTPLHPPAPVPPQTSKPEPPKPAAPVPTPKQAPSPAPQPTPTPAAQPSPANPSPMTEIHCTLRDTGKYLCVEPGTTAIEWRQSPGPWEQVTITPMPGERFAAKFDAAGVYLCITPNGDLETRAEVGVWEAHLVAEMPPDWQTALLYRVEDGVVRGVVEVVR